MLNSKSPAAGVWLALTLSLGLVCPLASIAEDARKADDDAAREAIVRIARGYKLFIGPDRRPLEMQPEPVLRWPNPTREVPEGATFLWTLDGRPEAIGCVWKHGILSHAFHSLSSSKLAAQHGDVTVWQPAKAGITLLDFPNAPQPADSAVKRLSQMKDLARRFSCRLAGKGAKGEELRLLPSPLYRYKTDRRDLIDGALFAYVQGTDPEVILVLEDRRTEEKERWQYALTRRSMLALEARLDGETVWSVPYGAGAPDESWFQGGIANVE
jgi:hypothetical protein